MNYIRKKFLSPMLLMIYKDAMSLILVELVNLYFNGVPTSEYLHTQKVVHINLNWQSYLFIDSFIFCVSYSIFAYFVQCFTFQYLTKF